ncbi:MAG: hypothetical protein AB7G11_07420 [Phycisphaerales bacterium]
MKARAVFFSLLPVVVGLAVYRFGFWQQSVWIDALFLIGTLTLLILAVRWWLSILHGTQQRMASEDDDEHGTRRH